MLHRVTTLVAALLWFGCGTTPASSTVSAGPDPPDAPLDTVEPSHDGAGQTDAAAAGDADRAADVGPGFPSEVCDNGIDDDFDDQADCLDSDCFDLPQCAGCESVREWLGVWEVGAWEADAAEAASEYLRTRLNARGWRYGPAPLGVQLHDPRPVCSPETVRVRIGGLGPRGHNDRISWSADHAEHRVDMDASSGTFEGFVSPDGAMLLAIATTYPPSMPVPLTEATVEGRFVRRPDGDVELHVALSGILTRDDARETMVTDPDEEGELVPLDRLLRPTTLDHPPNLPDPEQTGWVVHLRAVAVWDELLQALWAEPWVPEGP